MARRKTGSEQYLVTWLILDRLLNWLSLLLLLLLSLLLLFLLLLSASRGCTVHAAALGIRKALTHLVTRSHLNH